MTSKVFTSSDLGKRGRHFRWQEGGREGRGKGGAEKAAARVEVAPRGSAPAPSQGP